MSTQYDFVAIGDIVIDAFIQLDEHHAVVDKNPDTGKKRLSMQFGSKLPYKDVTVVNAVGNSPNAAVSAHRLGLQSAIYTNLGVDRNGKDCMKALRDEGVHTDFVIQHEGKHTNYHYVLRHGAERTILINHEEYPYALPDFATPPRYFYFSSVGENSIPFHHEVAAYIQKHDTKLVFQPGTFQIKLGYETLKDIYQNTEIFFCNKEEAQSILETDEGDMVKLVQMMFERGPKLPVITDGPEGAWAREMSDGSVWHMPMYPDPAPPVDRTGAGDSFSSTFTCAIALGHDTATALSWGPINSMSVVQHIGAQKGLLAREKLEEYLAGRPEDYVASKVS